MIKTAFPDFFEGNAYLIDEFVGLLKLSNSYKVCDAKGTQIGIIRQHVKGWHKALRIFVQMRAIMPFTLHVHDMDGDIQTTICRGWTLFMSKIELRNSEGKKIGKISQKFKFFTPTFNIEDVQDNIIAIVSGDWKAWNFTIVDPAGKTIGTISKNWNGLLKETLTSADKYAVTIDPTVDGDLYKLAIVSAAITIDMVLKEAK